MLPPELLGGGEIERTRCVLAVEGVRFLAREIKMLRAQQFRDVGRALIEPLEIPLKDGASRAGVTGATSGLRERRAEAIKFADIALQENHVAAVERIEITVEEFAGEFVVERVMGELRTFQNLPLTW
jgi:hypothetical protein